VEKNLIEYDRLSLQLKIVIILLLVRNESCRKARDSKNLPLYVCKIVTVSRC
jgi:hypothetical protein